MNHSALSVIMTNKTLPNVSRLVDKVCQAQDPSCGDGYMWNAGPH